MRFLRNLSCLAQKHSPCRFVYAFQTCQCQQYSSSSNDSNDSKQTNAETMENPIHRTFRVLKGDIVRFKDEWSNVLGITAKESEDPKTNVIFRDTFDEFQEHCDVLIVGGGIIGSSIAYWLKQKTGKALNVMVVEKDPTYKNAATTLSCGGLRQQFSLKENIEMSKFGAQFLREAGKRLHVEGHDPPDVQFNPQGYLFLSTEEGAEQLKKNYDLQMNLGVKNELLTAHQLKTKFPWLNTEGIALGCLGLEDEGWFDPWSLLDALKKKSISEGAKFVQGEVMDFECMLQADTFTDVAAPGSFESLQFANVKMPSGELRQVRFAWLVLATGSNSGIMGYHAGFGRKSGLRSTPIPVEPRKRYVYCVHCPEGPGLDLPFVIDPTGTYVRREGLGGNYICGRSPPDGQPEPIAEDFEVDHDFFQNHVWPNLANRIPKFEQLKVTGSWAGHYDYNYFDQNAIIGPHPYHLNVMIATGFSGHGLQQAPAVGRAVTEWILENKFLTIDLSRFSFDRILSGDRVLERNIV